MIYLDNASTTKVSNVACKAAVEVMLNKYGNPSSVHGFGLESEMIIRNAREIINKIIDGESRDLVYFTSGGTEANNLAITGSAKAKSKQGKGIVCSEYEHSSCYEAVKELEKLGYTVTYVKPEKDGTINPVTFADAVCCDTVLAVCMAVNNETGGINNIARMVKLARKKNPSVHFHCDGVQAFCKIPISAKKWDVDSLSVSGHKIAAPKGIGALYLKKGVRILPSIYGGSQQNKVRPGTENLSGIAAMGAACEDYYENGHKYNEKIEELNLYAKEVFANKGIKYSAVTGQFQI